MATFEELPEKETNIDIDPIITTNPTPRSPINSNVNSNKFPKIDTSALNGLRGILAVHIMVNHSFEFSKLKLTLLASVDMPLFFVISGFIFALNDGSKKIYSQTKCCSELKKFTEEDEQNDKFNARNFYLRRIARTIPLYYLTSFICEPLVYFGYSSLVSPGIMNYITILLTLTCTGSWFGPFLLNLPAWFVSTIWFFYWCFPNLLPKLQSYTVRGLRLSIIFHYILQFFIGIIIYVPLHYFMDGGISDFAFNIATMWPPSRLPVFLMGILAGLLRNKSIPIREGQVNYTTADWSKWCNYLWFGMNFALIGGIVAERLTNGVTAMNFWMQLIMVWFQLEFIYALTSDNGQSITYKFLSSKLLVFLGRISYSLYLIHFPIIGYICWIINGLKENTMPSCPYDSDDKQCSDEWDTYNGNRLLPIWCIPIHIAVSFILAILLNRVFEEPMRALLRPQKCPNKTIMNPQ